MADSSWDLDFDLDVDFSVLDGYDDDSEELKFDLYLLTREIKQISDSLQNVSILPKAKQQAWVKENRSQLHKLMDGLVKETMELFDGMEFDKDTLSESISCMTELRSLMTQLHNIMGDTHQLRG
jgi:hypothetical protein